MAVRFLLSTIVVAIIAIGIYYTFIHSEPLPSIQKRVKQWGTSSDTSVRAFQVNVPNSTLDDLRKRLAQTRFAETWELPDFSYGFSSKTLQKVVKYWQNDYDWHKYEKELNSLPQFTTSIGGLDIHFIHAKPHSGIKGIPILLLHGWPGSVWEFYKMIPLLTNDKDISFDVVCPSLPGYGFSQASQKPGLDVIEAAHIFVALMKKLGYEKFYVQGGDWGSFIATAMAQLYPEHVLGLHVNMFIVNAGPALLRRLIAGIHPIFAQLVGCSDTDYKLLPNFKDEMLYILQETGYFHLQATKPDTVGCALHDSPAGLAAYILEKFSTWTHAKFRNAPDGGLFNKDFPFKLDDMLTNVMIYWVSGTATSSVRFYKELFRNSENYNVLESSPVTVPTGLARFPEEIGYSAEFMAKSKFHSIVQYNVMPRGGHFAAFEEPKLMADDIKSFVQIVEAAIH